MVGEIKNVILTLSVDPRIHQTIGIVIADIPGAYIMWLSRDWLEKIKGYFSIEWSHLWLPYNGKTNQIKIVRGPYMKQTVTDLNDPSEPVVFFSSAIEHYTFDSFFGNSPTKSSPVEDVDNCEKSIIAMLFHLLVLLMILYIISIPILEYM